MLIQTVILIVAVIFLFIVSDSDASEQNRRSQSLTKLREQGLLITINESWNSKDARASQVASSTAVSLGLGIIQSYILNEFDIKGLDRRIDSVFSSGSIRYTIYF